MARVSSSQRAREQHEWNREVTDYAERLRPLPRKEREARLDEYVNGTYAMRMLGYSQKLELAALAQLHSEETEN